MAAGPQPVRASGRAGAPRPDAGRSPPAGRAAPAARAPPRWRPPGGAPPGCTSSRNKPRRSSQSRSTSAGVIDGSPAATRARHQSTLVITSQTTGPPRSRSAARPSRGGGCGRRAAESRSRRGAPAPDRVELRRRVEPRLVGLDEPQQAVAVEVAVGAQPLVVGGDPRLGGRVADGDPPRPGQQRRLDRPGHLGVAAGHVVVDQPPARSPAGPRRRVADEAVGAHRRSRLSSSARERPASKRRQTIAAKHESQYHCQG